jgi:hypothetical protein
MAIGRKPGSHQIEYGKVSNLVQEEKIYVTLEDKTSETLRCLRA